MVQQEEREDASKLKKEQEEAEQKALEEAKNSPAARMMSMADAAGNGINVQDLEANIQASLQAKIDAGASKSEILAQATSEEFTPAVSAAQSVVASVLAKHNLKTAAPVAASLSKASENLAQAQASQEKVKEMAQKLGIPFTADLLALGSNSAISDALIEKAVAAGKSEAQINDAMASL